MKQAALTIHSLHRVAQKLLWLFVLHVNNILGSNKHIGKLASYIQSPVPVPCQSQGTVLVALLLPLAVVHAHSPPAIIVQAHSPVVPSPLPPPATVVHAHSPVVPLPLPPVAVVQIHLPSPKAV